MSRLGFGPSCLRFALACLGVVAGLSAPLGTDLRSEVRVADEATGPSARSQRAEGFSVRPAAADQLAQSDGRLTEAELRRAIREIGHLGSFFGRLATYEVSADRRSYWEDLRVAYAAAAERLQSLLANGGLSLADLPAGQTNTPKDNGIVIDATLDGAWQPERQRRAAGEDAWRESHRLAAAIFEGLAALEGYGRWSWFDAHLKRSPTAGVMEPGSEPVAGPLLTRYWFAKDWYLWAAVAAEAADEQDLRGLWAARREELAVRADKAVEATRTVLGEAWHTALAANWQQHVATAEVIAVGFASVSAMAEAFPMAGDQAVGSESGTAPATLDAARGGEITALRSRLAELEAERRANEGRVAELEAARASDQERVAELETRLAALREELAASVDQSSAIERVLSETLRNPGGLGSEQGELRESMQAQGRQIAAERQRIAELEQRLSVLVAQLEESRAEIGLYQSQIQENQEELTRYRDEMRTTGEVLSRYREELDAAQDRQSQSILSLAQSFSSRQTAVIGLAVVLLLLSMLTIAVLLRRTPATGATAPARTGQDRGGPAPRGDDRAPADRTATPTRTDGAAAKPGRAESEALAKRKDAPRDRLLALAGERIEVAIPILAHSEALTDEDLIDLIGRTTTQHRMAIAMRPTLTQRVVDALVAQGEAKVLGAVLRNGAADITAETFEKLAGQAAKLPALKISLLNRPGLPRAIRERLDSAPERAASPPAKGPTVPGADRTPTETDEAAATPQPDIAAKLEAAAAALDAAAQEAAARDREAAAAKESAEAEPTRSEATDDAEHAAPSTTPGGVAASGEIAPHALIEALRQGKMELFEALFSKMTGLRPPRLQQVIYGASGENLAIACRALGLGKPLMTSIFIWSRKGRAELGAVNPRELSSAMTIFDQTTPETAKEMTAAWIRGEAIPGEWDRRLQGPAAE